MAEHACAACTPTGGDTRASRRHDSAMLRGCGRHTGEMVELGGGPFSMGADDDSSYLSDGEAPVHTVTLAPFAIAAHTVTNEDFAEFVAATGYVTDAELCGWSFVFAGLLPANFPETRGVVEAPWWRQVFGATWRSPEGPESHVGGRRDHPVVHVSWNDSTAYCAWSGTRLPTEAEWEYAARGGLDGKRFPWGDELEPGGEHLMNVFQGHFPSDDTAADGYAGTAPVGAFAPNGFRLFNMTGNVWEWCSDWFSADYYSSSPQVGPSGPESGRQRVMRGGSYLCHESYCRRYRVSARSSNSPDSSTGNLGFRIAR